MNLIVIKSPKLSSPMPHPICISRNKEYMHSSILVNTIKLNSIYASLKHKGRFVGPTIDMKKV